MGRGFVAVLITVRSIKRLGSVWRSYASFILGCKVDVLVQCSPKRGLIGALVLQ